MKRWLYRIVLFVCLAIGGFFVAVAFENNNAWVPGILGLFFVCSAFVVKWFRDRRPAPSPQGGNDRNSFARALLRAWNVGGKETIDDFGRAEPGEAAANLHVAALLTEEVVRLVEAPVSTSRIRESIALRAHGEFAAAAAAIDGGAQEDVERDVSALTARGLGHLGAGKRDKALEDFRRADRRLAHMAGAIESNIAAALIEEGQFEEARRAAERGIEHMARSAQTTGHWLPHSYRVSALELSGDPDGAAVALQTMVDAIKEPEERLRAAAYVKRQAPLAALRRRVDFDEVFGVDRKRGQLAT